MTPGIAIATYLALGAVLLGLFAGSSRRLDADTRARMSRWMSADGSGDWAQGFVRWFDHAFAVRARRLPLLGEVTLPSFARSILVSFLSLLVLALVWVSNKPGMDRAMAHGEMTPAAQDMLVRLIIVYGGATLITNWIPDYLSLVESRYIIGKLAQAKRWWQRLAYLALDAAATLAISFFAIHLGMVLLLPVVSPQLDLEVGCLTPAIYSIDTTWELFVAGLRFESPPGTINYDATGIYLYSTFLTSLWVWAYLGGGLLLRGLFALRGSFAGRGRAAKAPRHPLRALALVVLVGFSAVFWPSWAWRRAHDADVFIVHAKADTPAVLELKAELEAGGLRVRTSLDTSAERAAELLHEADAVLLVDSSAADGSLDAIGEELHMMGECGERAWGSSARVELDGVNPWFGPRPVERFGDAFEWQPGVGARPPPRRPAAQPRADLRVPAAGHDPPAAGPRRLSASLTVPVSERRSACSSPRRRACPC
jgi:hypothetical protein